MSKTVLKTILCTGGAGYIGSHTAVQLANTGRYKVLVVDNFSNSCKQTIEEIKKLCPPDTIEVVELDIATEPHKLENLKYDGVIHFAALKAVGESVEQPLRYYRNNLNCMINTIEAAQKCGGKVFVFSSSATVYQPAEGLLNEEYPLGPSNPYGQTKMFGEQILKDVCVSDPEFKVISLRYFNPIGAHESGSIGEDATKAANIMPAIHRALFMGQTLKVFGQDWETRDGTGVRDYVHVMDLADGHVAALDALFRSETGKYETYNLGTGNGVSVRELISSFEKASGRKIQAVDAPRRAGDLATVVANPEKAIKELGYKNSRSTEQACKDGWRWMESHPYGYKTEAQ